MIGYKIGNVAGDSGEDRETAVVCLEKEVAAGDPGGGQPTARDLALEDLLEGEPSPGPVEELVHVAEAVDGREDTRHHSCDHQQREDHRQPIPALPALWVAELLRGYTFNIC